VQGVLAITSVSSVTAPLWASVRPCTVTPVVTVIDVRAKMTPVNAEPVPSVAELETCQKTLHGLALLIRRTELADAVVSVEPSWNTKTASGLPAPLSVRMPVRVTAPVAL